MIVARRVYLYAIAYAGLGMLVAGLAMVFEIVLEALAEQVLGPFAAIGSSEQVRRISLAAATGGIGLVAWAIHWGLASRAVRGADEAAERSSAIRKLYL